MSLRPVAAGFVLGLRAPLRSRLVAALLVLLAAAVFVLPAQLQSDGTDASTLRMTLTWTLGTAFLLLCAVSLWSGCASFSCELADRRFIGAAVSPASRLSLLTGRWLGLVALNALLLAAVLAGTWAQLRVRGLDAARTEVRAVLEPTADCVDREAHRMFSLVFPDGAPAELGTDAEVLEAFRRELAGSSHMSVGPGGRMRWHLRGPGADAPADARIELHFVSAHGTMEGVAGRLTLRDPAGRTLAEVPTGPSDPGFVRAGLPDGALAGVPEIEAEFVNLESPDGGPSVMIRHADALRVTVPGGGLPGNLLRTGLVLLSALSLLSALGLALGCVFSFPVATFVSTALCAMALAAPRADDGPRTTAHSHTFATASSFARATDRFAKRVGAGFDAVLAPFDRAHALDRLGDGLLIPLREAVAAVAADGAALPLLIGLLGAAALRRREIP